MPLPTGDPDDSSPDEEYIPSDAEAVNVK